MAGEPQLFDEVRDALEGLVDSDLGELHTKVHRGGIKVWFDAALKEHYEAQWIRGHHLDRSREDWYIEIGFHSEYPKVAANDEVLTRIGSEALTTIGGEVEAGEFLGASNWRRISEVWDPPEPDDPDIAIEIAARLADYIDAIEPLRTVG